MSWWEAVPPCHREANGTATARPDSRTVQTAAPLPAAGPGDVGWKGGGGGGAAVRVRGRCTL